MRKIAIIIGAALAALTAGLVLASTAGAGTGPDGFAIHARQGIVSYNNRIYGNGNSPWKVTCTDHPDFATMSDRVVCRITLKSP